MKNNNSKELVLFDEENMSMYIEQLITNNYLKLDEQKLLMRSLPIHQGTFTTDLNRWIFLKPHDQNDFIDGKDLYSEFFNCNTDKDKQEWVASQLFGETFSPSQQKSAEILFNYYGQHLQYLPHNGLGCYLDPYQNSIMTLIGPMVFTHGTPKIYGMGDKILLDVEVLNQNKKFKLNLGKGHKSYHFDIAMHVQYEILPNIHDIRLTKMVATGTDIIYFKQLINGAISITDFLQIIKIKPEFRQNKLNFIHLNREFLFNQQLPEFNKLSFEGRAATILKLGNMWLPEYITKQLTINDWYQLAIQAKQEESAKQAPGLYFIFRRQALANMFLNEVEFTNWSDKQQYAFLSSIVDLKGNKYDQLLHIALTKADYSNLSLDKKLAIALQIKDQNLLHSILRDEDYNKLPLERRCDAIFLLHTPELLQDLVANNDLSKMSIDYRKRFLCIYFDHRTGCFRETEKAKELRNLVLQKTNYNALPCSTKCKIILATLDAKLLTDIIGDKDYARMDLQFKKELLCLSYRFKIDRQKISWQLDDLYSDTRFLQLDVNKQLDLLDFIDAQQIKNYLIQKGKHEAIFDICNKFGDINIVDAFFASEEFHKQPMSIMRRSVVKSNNPAITHKFAKKIGAFKSQKTRHENVSLAWSSSSKTALRLVKSDSVFSQMFGAYRLSISDAIALIEIHASRKNPYNPKTDTNNFNTFEQNKKNLISHLYNYHIRGKGKWALFARDRFNKLNHAQLLSLYNKTHSYIDDADIKIKLGDELNRKTYSSTESTLLIGGKLNVSMLEKIDTEIGLDTMGMQKFTFGKMFRKQPQHITTFNTQFTTNPNS